MYVSPCSLLNKEFDSLNWNDVVEVFIEALSQNYEALVKHCIGYFLDQVKISNVCSFLELSMMFFIQKLYEKCLEICTEIGFVLLELDDFYSVRLETTVVAIASQPKLNVAGETELFYALWLKATIDCCRNDSKLTTQNIAKFFKHYAACIHFEGIDGKKLKTYNNDTIMEYYEWMKTSPKVAAVPARKYRYPSKLDPKFFFCYELKKFTDFVSFHEKKYETKFSVESDAYLLQVKLSCIISVPFHEVSKISFCLKNGETVMLEVKNILNYSFKSRNRESVRYFAGNRIEEFVYNLPTVTKLSPRVTYSLAIEKSPSKLLWASGVSEGNTFIKFQSGNISCLTGMKLLKIS